MGRRWLIVACACLVLLPVIMTGCSRDDVAIVRIQLQNMPQGAPQNTSSIFERVFRWFVTDAIAGWSYPNTALQVVLTAPDLEDVTFNVPYEQQSTITIEVPSGSNRKITVYGFNDYTEYIEKTWGGHVEVDLNPGDEVEVQINMLPVVTPWASQEGTAYINWNPVSTQEPVFGVQGYNIYRSDSGPEGPFNLIGTAESGYIDSDYYDWSIDPEQSFYYAVSVFTATMEGELSEPCLYQPALVIGNIQ